MVRNADGTRITTRPNTEHTPNNAIRKPLRRQCSPITNLIQDAGFPRFFVFSSLQAILFC